MAWGREGVMCGGDSGGVAVDTVIYFRLTFKGNSLFFFRINSIVSLLVPFEAALVVFREPFGKTVPKGCCSLPATTSSITRGIFGS